MGKFKQGMRFKFGNSVLNQLFSTFAERPRGYSEADLASLASQLGGNPEIYEDILKAQACHLALLS